MKLPFSKLETNRLCLRKLRYEDREALFDMRSQSLMNQFVDMTPDISMEQTLKYIDKMNIGITDSRWLIWGIIEKGTDQIIGTISLSNFKEYPSSCELGYAITPSKQRQGFSFEAIQKVKEYAFQELSLDYMEAFTETSNLPSIQLLKKCGFQFIETIEESGFHKNRIFHMQVFQYKRSKAETTNE